MSSNIRGWAKHGKINVDALAIADAVFQGSAGDLNAIAGLAARNSRVPRAIALPLVGGTDTPGGLIAWKNSEPSPIVVDRVTVDVTTPATAACTVKAGSSPDGATVSNNLIDTLDVHTAIVTANNQSNPGTNGKALQRVPVGGWVTISTGSGASAGLVGSVVIGYELLT